jgi:hypothetical protein
MEWIIIIRGPLLLLARDLEILGDGPGLKVNIFCQKLMEWTKMTNKDIFKGPKRNYFSLYMEPMWNQKSLYETNK